MLEKVVKERDMQAEASLEEGGVLDPGRRNNMSKGPEVGMS